jgi:4-amino-4-deoxy-L-arabinose transferase-like glycosyltransferase
VRAADGAANGEPPNGRNDQPRTARKEDQPRTARTTRIILLCVIAGLVLRLAFALVYWVGQPLTHDEREYLALARSVARGDGFTYPADEPSPGTGQQFGRAPGYPLFLAALGVSAPSDHPPRRVRIAQACVGALGIWLMASIARRAAGDRAAIVAAAVAAVYPPLVFMPAYVLSETLYSTLALAIALVLGSDRGQTGVRPGSDRGQTGVRPGSDPFWIVDGRVAVFAGLLTGIAILTRPATLFFLPFLTLWMGRKRAYFAATAFLVATTLCVVPWTIRNHRVYGRWVAVASEGGVTFWTGNHPLAVGDGDLAANPAIKRAELAFRAAHPGLTPEQLEPLYYRDAVDWIRREPAAWLALMARKAFYTVVPLGPSYALHSGKYVAASVVPYLLVLPAAIAGALSWRHTRRIGGSPAPLWLMAAGTIAAGLVFFPQERFRIPVIDPALIVTAALGAGLRNHERTDRHAHL